MRNGWLRNDWAVQRRQFGVLYRVFLMRVVDLELLSADADTTRLLGQFATIFASLSFLFTVPMIVALPMFAMGKGASGMLTAVWMPEHFFIANTMLVAGVLAVLTWDSAFPDRRDVLVLAPLPVRASTLFGAKICALFAAPVLAVGCLNVFSGVLWPALFSVHGRGTLHALRAWPAYWVTMVLAGVFVFCSLLAVQGLAANLLPRQWFLRMSASLQAGALCVLLSVYFLEPTLESPAALMAAANQRLLAWLPAYWFLGLFQQINGSVHPAFGGLATRAWVGVGLAVAGAGVALLLSYFRMLPKIVEQPEIVKGRSVSAWRMSVGSSLATAIVAFTVRTLVRSRQHRMILSFYLGIGLAILVGYLKGPFGPNGHAQTGFGVVVLVSSTMMMLLSVMAMRVVATVPITVRANWIFRVTQVRPAGEYQRAVRMSWLLSVGGVWSIAAALLFAFYPWRLVVGHVLVLLAVGILAVEVCLYGFAKVSFTCSYLPGKANIHFVFWGSLALVVWVLNEAATLEMRWLMRLGSASLTVLAVAGAAGAARWWNGSREGGTRELTFEEETPPMLVTLNLK